MTEQISAAVYRGNRQFEVTTLDLVPPAADEVAVRVAYCGICGTDMHVFHGNMDARVGFERIIGHEMSGTVAAVGSAVSGFSPGDTVVVRPLAACGDCPACEAGHNHICHNLDFLGLDTNGAMQQVWNVPAHTLHTLPADMNLKDAALVEPLAVACHDVRMSALQAGETALVIGGGPIGALVAMVAREQGANVIVSEVNPSRIEIARSLGFDTVNPTELDLQAEVNARTDNKGADVVFEVSGSQPGVDAMTACAATRARLVMVAIHAQKPEVDLFQFFWRELQLIGVRVYEPDDYADAIRLLAAGKIDTGKMITDVQPLSDIQAAFESLDGNPTALKSLIQVAGDTQ